MQHVGRQAQGRDRACGDAPAWGSYQDIDRGERFRGGLTVNPAGKLSLQSHKHRAEHWVVVRASPEVMLDGKVMTLRENEIDLHPDRRRPPAEQPGQPSRSEVVEVQTGDLEEGRHHPLRGHLRPHLARRAYAPRLGVRSKTIGLGRRHRFLEMHAQAAHNDRHLATDEAQQQRRRSAAAASRRGG